jgi:hypothetical protein
LLPLSIFIAEFMLKEHIDSAFAANQTRYALLRSNSDLPLTMLHQYALSRKTHAMPIDKGSN